MADLSHFLPHIILASQSVARKALLEEMGIEVTTCPTHSDESHNLSDPDQVVAMLAMRKLESYRETHPTYSLPVICCDTLISFQGKLIGKPSNREEAKSQLQAFSGKAQLVHSGWALWYGKTIYGDSDQAKVCFRTLTDADIEAYLDTLEWKGAAGSYRIQGKGQGLIESIEGDKGTIIGLPIEQIYRMLINRY